MRHPCTTLEMGYYSGSLGDLHCDILWWGAELCVFLETNHCIRLLRISLTSLGPPISLTHITYFTKSSPGLSRHKTKAQSKVNATLNPPPASVCVCQRLRESRCVCWCYFKANCVWQAERTMKSTVCICARYSLLLFFPHSIFTVRTCLLSRLTSVELSVCDRWNHLLTEGTASTAAPWPDPLLLQIADSPQRAPGYHAFHTHSRAA